MSIKNVLLLVLIVALIAGCETTGSRRSSSGDLPKALDVSMSLKFEDVPIPAGFQPLAQESFIFQNELLRVGILKYKGKAHADQVVNFYKDQMSLYNWRFLNMVEYGRRIMNFDREDQTCIIVIEPASMGTYITITVSPKGGRAGTYKSTRKGE
jgi:hypothetical protein